MRSKNQYKFAPDRYSASTVLTESDILNKGHFVADTAEIYFTLPDPRNPTEDWEAKFTNASSGYILVNTSQDLTDQSDSVAIPPGASVKFVCTRVSDTAPYRHAWVAQGQDEPPKWSAWTPTNTFTTATPIASSTSYRYQICDGVLHFDYDFATADGGGATALTFTLPFIPQDIDIIVPVTASVVIGSGNATNILGYIDATNATAETRAKVQFYNFQTLTDDSAARIRVSGHVPIYGFTSFTSTPAWTGGPPTVTSTTSVYKVVDGCCYGYLYHIESDGKGTTAGTFTVPVQHNDVDQLIACQGIEALDTGGTPAYSNPVPYIEAANATSANRLLSFADLTTLTNGKECAIMLAFQYGVHGELDYTPTETFTTADPASYTSVFRYSVSKRKVRFAYYGTSADGNGASGLTVTLPLPPRYTATRRKALNGVQLVDSTYSDPAAYIEHGSATEATRALINFEYFSTCTDAKTATFMVQGEYEI